MRPIALATAAVATAALSVLAGCGVESSTELSGRVVRPDPSAAALEAQFVKVVKRVSPAVVQLRCRNALGSGIVFDAGGNVVTNAHVVGKARRCVLTLSGGDRHAANVVGRDVGNDIAVVRLGDTQPQPAAFADSSKVQVGDLVMAMGNPLGLRSSVTQGIVSSLNRNVAESASTDLTSLMQTSAEINPGNSGGALVDLSGRVVGIPTLTATDPEFGGAQAPGIGFAIPSNVVRSVASSLISGG